MKKIRSPHRHIEVDTLREAVINHAYRSNMPDSVIEGIRKISDLWLLTRRDQPYDDIMREAKSLQNDPDIARITNDLQQPAEHSRETGPTLREYATRPESDWMMV